MWSNFGRFINVNIFGESHGEAIGIVITGLPAGEKIDMDQILVQMARRAPGHDCVSTPRKEDDFPHIVSGMSDDYTTGAPLCAVIQNTNKRSSDYSDLLDFPRPSHADYAAFIKYGKYADRRGGGPFSGRLTAPLVFAGAVARQILERRRILVRGHIFSIGEVYDDPFCFDVCADCIFKLNKSNFAVLSSTAEKRMRETIEAAKKNKDSVGGVAEVIVLGVPAGLGSPMFYGVENVLSGLIFGVPGVKGVEFGSGFKLAQMKGTEANDEFLFDSSVVKTKTNHSGGIQGGISNGMPIVVRAAFKPTPSISATQKTVNLASMTNASISIKGRHDPCIVPRGLVAVEAAVSIGILDLLKEADKI